MHVDVGIGDNRASRAIDDLAVDTRIMTPFFLDHLERTGLGQMSIASARNRRLHDHTPPANQIGRLLAEIDLNPVRIFILSKGDGRDANKN